MGFPEFLMIQAKALPGLLMSLVVVIGVKDLRSATCGPVFRELRSFARRFASLTPPRASLVFLSGPESPGVVGHIESRNPRESLKSHFLVGCCGRRQGLELLTC